MFPASKLLFFVLIASTTSFALPTGERTPAASNNALTASAAPPQQTATIPKAGKKIKEIVSGGERELESDLASRGFNDVVSKVGSAPGGPRRAAEAARKAKGKRDATELEARQKVPGKRPKTVPGTIAKPPKRDLANEIQLVARQEKRKQKSPGPVKAKLPGKRAVVNEAEIEARQERPKPKDVRVPFKGKPSIAGGAKKRDLGNEVLLEARQKAKKPNVEEVVGPMGPAVAKKLFPGGGKKKRGLHTVNRLVARQKAAKKPDAKKVLGPGADAAKKLFPGAGGKKRSLELEGRAIKKLPISTTPKVGPGAQGPGGKAGKKRDLELELDARAAPSKAGKGMKGGTPRPNSAPKAKPGPGNKRDLAFEGELQARAGKAPAGAADAGSKGTKAGAKKGKKGGRV